MQTTLRIDDETHRAAQALALEIAGRFQASDFDALILSAARLASCIGLYSEDLAAAQDHGGVRVENPLPA